MMNAVLVDDDIEMLEMLSHLIDWQTYGFSISGKYNNGENALKSIGEEKVDLLVTDITMPAMDGFELARNLRKINPEMNVIFLTCHEDFSYAKEAIQIGADDYLVKYTLTKEKLIESLNKMSIKYNKRNNMNEKINRYTEEMNENRNNFKESLLYSIVKDLTQDIDGLSEKMSLYQIKKPSHSYCLIGLYVNYNERILIENGEPQKKLWRYEIADIISEELNNNGITDEVFPYDKYVIILHEWNSWDKTFSIKYKTIIEKICNIINETMRMRLAICVSDTYDTFWDIKKGIVDLDNRKTAPFYLKGKMELRHDDLKKFTAVSHEIFNRLNERFKIAFRDGENFIEEMDNLCTEIEKKNYNPDIIRKLFQLFLFSIYKETIKMDKSINEIPLEDASFQFCKDALYQQYDWYIGNYKEQLNKNYNDDIKSILSYVDENLDKPISLQGVADNIYKNSSYLSRLFKQNIGMSFTDYLIKRRIEMATYLLTETNLSVEEVGRRVGINNVSYFYRFYKRETGKTPKNNNS